MKRQPVGFRFILMIFLLVSLSACDDPTTSLVVTYEGGTTADNHPLRIIVALPDGTTNTASLQPGESSTFRSLFEGAYGVKAVVDLSYTQELRQRRDKLLGKLAAADVLGEQLTSEQRVELNNNIDSLIEQVNEMAELSGATACIVEPESVGNVGILVKEDNVGINDFVVIDVYCK